MSTADRIVYTTLRIAFEKLIDSVDDDRNLVNATKAAFTEITGHNGTFPLPKEKAKAKPAPSVKSIKQSISWTDIGDEYVCTDSIQFDDGYYPVKEKKGLVVTFAVNNEGETRWITINDAKILRANKLAYKI